MEPKPDTDLLRLAQAGDREAFDSLVSRHGRMVLSIAKGVTRNTADAEDVAQEVFVRFFRSLKRVDPERPLEPWLVRLTLNAAKSLVGRSPRLREQILPDPEAQASAGGGPAEALNRQEFSNALGEALNSLADREREVFQLRDLQGLDTGLIAEALGVSDITVRRQSGEARRKVLEWFRRHRPEFLSRGMGEK